MTNKILTQKIAEPYASALLNLSISTHNVDLVTIDINDLLKLFRSNKELKNYLTNPLHSKSSKKNVIKKLVGPEPSNQNVMRLLMLLIDRSRVDIFEAVAEKYLKLVYDLAEIKIARIKSAFALNSDQEQEIVAQLKKRTGAKEIKIVNSIDKSLLGGLQVEIDSSVIDVSLKGQLRQLATQLETTLF
jgi:F-type H+-transporting ATPase subunit delta